MFFGFGKLALMAVVKSKVGSPKSLSRTKKMRFSFVGSWYGVTHRSRQPASPNAYSGLGDKRNARYSCLGDNTWIAFDR